jgi:hypothetical protein
VGKSKGLTATQLRTLDRLSRIPELKRFYLAGGTAIATHLGHRSSKDLDLFSMDATAQLPATAYVKRFDVDRSDLYAVLRSLTYFADAEAELLWPEGLNAAHWRTIRSYFETQAPRLLSLPERNTGK